MLSMPPLMRISVCIATYNGERYIAEQLRSVLVQLSEKDEVIISDDGSIDKTLALIESFNDPRVRIFHHNKRNAARNFENALAKASGEFIFLADQDDVWLDDKVAGMMKELENSDLVVSDASIIDENGQILQQSYFGVRNSGPGVIKNFWKNSYLGCCMAFRRSVLIKAMPFPQNVKYHDYWIGLVGGIYFRCRFVDQVYTLYRKHDNNATNASGSTRNSLLKIIYFRLNLLSCLPYLLKR